MVPFVRNLTDWLGPNYLGTHAKAITAQQRKGRRDAIHIHTVSDQKAAYINENRWLIDCECGSGAYVDPAVGVACCFGCGAIHTTVILPADRAVIEAVLIARPSPFTRGWRDQDKAETLADLVRENIAHGIDVPKAAHDRVGDVPVIAAEEVVP